MTLYTYYLCHALLFQCIFAGEYSRLSSLLTLRRLISLACVSSETHNLQRVFRPGGEVVPYIGYIGMCRAKGCFFSCFGLK